jgi:hypothetical protein
MGMGANERPLDSLYCAFTVFGATGWFAPVVERIKEEWG